MVAPEFVTALGTPLPSNRSLGRLLAARAGHQQSGLELVRCAGRDDNCALWQVRPSHLTADAEGVGVQVYRITGALPDQTKFSPRAAGPT
jgi:hypothetical protein